VFYAFFEEVAAPSSFGVRSGVGNTNIGVGVGGGGFGWVKVSVAAYAKYHPQCESVTCVA
jgi:hypothetical protein